MKLGRWALAAGLVVLACGGGGGGRGPTAPPPSIAFTPAANSSTANLALIETAGGTATLLRLNLDAQLVSGLYGVAFDLVYPSDSVSFVAATEGTFFGGSGGTSLQVNSTTPGRVIVGLSRLGAVGGVSGSGTLLTLEFSSRGVAGSGSLTFANNAAFDSSARAIAGATWAAGSIAVTP